MVNRISIKITFGRYGQVTMSEQNTYRKFHKLREANRSDFVCLTFRYTSSSLIINLPQLAYV